MNISVKIGNFLFRHRSFTPVPLIIAVFLFFTPAIIPGRDNFLTSAGLLILIAGEIVRILSVGYSFAGTSGRENFLRADNLNVTGIYSIVRNPLYIGNLLIYTGLLIAYSNLWALVFFDSLLILQYYFIIQSEESFLEQTYGKEYLDYKKKVRSIIPSFREYKKPANPFNRIKVIMKENDSVFNALLIFGLIILYKEYLTSGKVLYGKSFVLYFGVLIISYILIKLIKKRVYRL